MTLKTHDPGVIPTDYSHYKSVLVKDVQKLMANARSPQRKSQYRPLAAISQGYDSSASAILAKEGGCLETVTLLDSREDDPKLDSGLENAGRLGMECHEVDRWSYETRDAACIAELAFFGISCGSPMAGFEELLPGRIFVSGHFGDTIYDPFKSAVCNELSQTWAKFASGVNMMEFRLRVGFLTFAPLLVMARHHRAIHDITHSPGMRPWHVEGTYNRPIARRIIEEAGVPRGSFAMLKRGGGHAHFRPKKKDLSPAMQSYREFLNQKRAQLSAPRRAYWRARVQMDHILWKYAGRSDKQIVPSTPMQRRFPFLLNCTPIKLTWDSMFTFQWAHSLLAQNYRLPEKRGELLSKAG